MSGSNGFYLHHPLAALGYLYLLILFVRAVLSWFPLAPGGVFARVNRVAFTLTEPLLRPIRRIVPPIGMFDVSFMVLLAIVYIVTNYVLASIRV
jgi:YggT family protein